MREVGYRTNRVEIGTSSAIILTAVAYFVAARAGLLLAIPPAFKASPVWPASGIALAGILLFGARAWPGVWLGAFLANVADYFLSRDRADLGTHVTVAFAIAVGSTLQSVLAARSLNRLLPTSNPLARGKDVLGFFGITCVACSIASTVGTATLALAGLTDANIFTNWLTWWVGDVTGIALITPLILTWSSGTKRSPSVWLQGIIVMSLVLVVGSLAFAGTIRNGALAASIAYLTVPLIVAATFRFGEYGATASLFLLAGIAVTGTAAGRGPFFFDRTADSLLSLQAFIGILCLTSLSLAAVLNERKEEARNKNAAIGKMQEALSEVRTLRGLIPICAWCRKVRNDAGAWEQLESYVRRNLDADFSHGICPDCFEAADSDPESARIKEG